jgi:hypothetical protein
MEQNEHSLEQLQARLHILEQQVKERETRGKERRKWFVAVASVIFAGSIGYSLVGNETHAERQNNKAAAANPVVQPMRFNNVDAFTATYDSGNKLSKAVHDKAYKLFTAADWQGLQRLFTLQGANGGWPPNNGFIRIDSMTLTVGTQIDRYGGYYVKSGSDSTFNDKGTFASPSGNSFASRALQQFKTSSYYRQYTVKKNIPNVQVGEAIPWFGFEGMGLQFNLPMNVSDLIQQGYIAAN